MAKSTPTIEGLTDTLRLQSQCSLIAPDDGCGNKSPTTFAAAKMKFTIPFPNDNNTTKGAYFSSSSSTPSATKTAPKKRPSRVTKTRRRIILCNTSDPELENDEDGYKLKKKLKLTLPTVTVMRRRLSDPRQIRRREPRIRKLWQKYFKKFISLRLS